MTTDIYDEKAKTGSDAALEAAPLRASTIPALARGELPGLDGLRAISVLLVMFSHYGYGKIVPGALGVTTFFFLSGFLITTLMMREVARTGHLAIGAFLMRRILRLAPELLGLIVVSGLAGALYIGLPRPADLFGAVFYVTNYLEIFALSGYFSPDIRWPHLWSLAVEQHFYLLYPLLVVSTIRSERKFVAALTLVCLAALLWRCFVMLRFNDPQYAYIATETRLDSIAYGCLAAFLMWTHGASVAAWLRGRNLALVVLGLGLIGLTLALRQHQLFRETLRYSLQGVGLMIFSAGLFLPPGANVILSALDWRPMRWMGRMSYAAYLWHLDVLKFMEWSFPSAAETAGTWRGAGFAIAAAAATFLVAWLSHVAIYNPVVRWRKRFGSHAN
jgi:peptidoglycan/LPS O-acetylase OafA/YrhL